MTRLVCSATNCLYNDDRYCCKGDIQIEGEGATTSNATCCSSFRERKGEMGRNAAMEPTRDIEIDCKACHCKYNEDCRCTADQIGIGGSHACKCQETECMTFCCQ
ncbi:MAG: DUF1540 domain-containing protein [Lachnospiraceae bacterium]|nr:DUF1540 domain-containing protein [Lachnospiraceae bacterium]